MPKQIIINQTIIEILEGDITVQEVDAIVNAANSKLAGGGGVDGAIHKAAGKKELLAATKSFGGCKTGDAKITPAFNLKAKYIIHAVGPVYRFMIRKGQAPALLRSAYQRSFELAVENGAVSIALPAISMGAYGYPLGAGSEIAIETAVDFAKENDGLELIRFVLMPSKVYRAFEKALEKIEN